MDGILQILARGLLAALRLLPLEWVARLGRGAGGLAYWVDGRHRRVAMQNIAASFQPEWPVRKVRELARENFRRIGESLACAARTSAMSDEEMLSRLEVVGAEHLFPAGPGAAAQKFVVAIGHFGNFEVYARVRRLAPGYRLATTFRGLRQPSLDRMLRALRERSGTLFFDRRNQARDLRHAMNEGRIILGLLADQHAGDHGLALPFLGRVCSTSPAPALFARRYGCPLHTAVCFRVGLARWRIEVGPSIPQERDGHALSPEEVMTSVNRVFEDAIRRDPANWFWVHNRWKGPGRFRQRDMTAAALAADDHEG